MSSDRCSDSNARKEGKKDPKTGAPLGHRNLAIRSGIAFSQGFSTLILFFYEVDVPHTLPTAICQFGASLTLFVQWKTANPWMFIARATANYVRSLVVLHAAICGRKWLGDECVDRAWSDVRMPFRLLHSFALIRLFLIGLSLTLQFFFPRHGVGAYGNVQLFYRGFIVLAGVPLHYTRAMLKLGELTGTPWERLPVEISINFFRAFILIPLASWSLFNQWLKAGSGRKTDDYRTSQAGDIVPRVAENISRYLEPHQGHRNLLIRSLMAFWQATVTMWLVVYDIDVPHKLPLAFMQLLSSVALLVQWRCGLSYMFLVRAAACFVRAALLIHLAVCGRVWLGESCQDSGWTDARQPFRKLHCLAALRMLLLGLSLCAQYACPHRGITAKHGHEQLFIRGCIRGAGIPLYFARAVQKFYDLSGTEYERSAVEIVTNLMRASLIIPIQTCSLLHEWRYTGKATDEFGEYQQEGVGIAQVVPVESGEQAATEIEKEPTKAGD